MTFSPAQRVEMRESLTGAPTGLRTLADAYEQLLPLLPKCLDPDCRCTAGGAHWLVTAIDKTVVGLMRDRAILTHWRDTVVETEGVSTPTPPI